MIDSQPAHILVVDDEATVRSVCARILQHAGYRTDEAEDGAAALALVQASHELLDLVVSDVVMPRMNGVELLEALSISHPKLPVLLMSAYSVETLRERGIAAPCAILVKPFTPQKLLAEVRRCLEPAA
jgi:two-component system cell cycle sensor histidine kinase/response regulator CckA